MIFVGLLLNVNVGADVGIGPYNGIILIDKLKLARIQKHKSLEKGLESLYNKQNSRRGDKK